MVVFQGLSKQFWQLILARLAMGVGQSAVEALSASMISDILPLGFVPIGESFLYVGVYVGEAVSARISAAFIETDTSWRAALIGVGIAGGIISIVMVVILREPEKRMVKLIAEEKERLTLEDETSVNSKNGSSSTSARIKDSELVKCLRYTLSLRSFYIIAVSAAFRQISGNVFGFYMPSYLQLVYSERKAYLVTTYGTIVGVVGSVASMLGGIISYLTRKRFPQMPLYLAAIGGLLSFPFVIVMVFSRTAANGDLDGGLRILFASMTLAYLTAEMWLGPVASCVLRIVPLRYKTLAFAIYGIINILIYSTGPEIVGIAQHETNSEAAEDPEAYIRVTRILLATIIPCGYIMAALGFLWAASASRYVQDVTRTTKALATGVDSLGTVNKRRKRTLQLGGSFLLALVIGLLATSFSIGV